jgi:hypothetical protein
MKLDKIPEFYSETADNADSLVHSTVSHKVRGMHVTHSSLKEMITI